MISLVIDPPSILPTHMLCGSLEVFFKKKRSHVIIATSTATSCSLQSIHLEAMYVGRIEAVQFRL